MIKSWKMFIKMTTNVLIIQMHFWFVDYMHEILMSFIVEFEGEIYSSR